MQGAAGSGAVRSRPRQPTEWHRVLDLAVAEVGLQRAGVVPGVR
jgi:hypothetical protein